MLVIPAIRPSVASWRPSKQVPATSLSCLAARSVGCQSRWRFPQSNDRLDFIWRMPMWGDAQGVPRFWPRPTDSGKTLECAFCPRCGTRLWHQQHGASATISIKGGSFDDPINIECATHIWTSASCRELLSLQKLPSSQRSHSANKHGRASCATASATADHTLLLKTGSSLSSEFLRHDTQRNAHNVGEGQVAGICFDGRYEATDGRIASAQGCACSGPAKQIAAA